MAELSVPTITVELAHDDGTGGWTDVTDYSFSNSVGVQCGRGRSRVLGEWQPGAMSVTLYSFLYKANPFAAYQRAFDPFDENPYIFEPKPGDAIRITAVPSGEAGAGVWRGWVDSVSVRLIKGSEGAYPRPIVTLQCSDALARAARVLSNALGDDDAMLSSSAISQTLTAVAWDAGSTVSTGTQYVSAAFYNVAVPATNNLLSWLQLVTATEGGASRLFADRGGSLVWRGRGWTAGTTLEVGEGTSYGIVEAGLDVTDDEWSSQVAVAPAAHTDVYSSSSSVAMGTGAKTFTISRVVAPCSAGATVTATATAGATPATGEVSAYMTGTVTSCTTTTLVIDVTSASGTGTGTAWSVETSEPGTGQVVTDTHAVTEFGAPRQRQVSTLHAYLPLALAEAGVRASEGAWPSKRIAEVTFELATLSAANQQTLLGLDIGDALDVSLAMSLGTAGLIHQIRFIDGIQHRLNGSSHQVTFTLGRYAMAAWTGTVKQNGSAVNSTASGEEMYQVRDGWCLARGGWGLTATASAGAIKITPSGLPTPLGGDMVHAGTFVVFDDSGGTFYVGSVRWDGTDLIPYNDGGTSMGVTPTVTLASSDSIAVNLSFPV